MWNHHHRLEITWSANFLLHHHRTHMVRARERYQREELIRSLTVNKNSSNLLIARFDCSTGAQPFIHARMETYGRVQARSTSLCECDLFLSRKKLIFHFCQINVLHCFTFFFTFLLDNNNSQPGPSSTLPQQWVEQFVTSNCWLSSFSRGSENQVEVRKEIPFHT